MDTKGNKIKDLDPEELESLAQRYSIRRFPNPQRFGCPPPVEIIKLVSERQTPGQALREHLFECSECFSEYYQGLAQCRLAPNEAAQRKRLLLIGALKLIATVTVLVILILTAFFFIN